MTPGWLVGYGASVGRFVGWLGSVEGPCKDFFKYLLWGTKSEICTCVKKRKSIELICTSFWFWTVMYLLYFNLYICKAAAAVWIFICSQFLWMMICATGRWKEKVLNEGGEWYIATMQCIQFMAQERLWITMPATTLPHFWKISFSVSWNICFPISFLVSRKVHFPTFFFFSL